LRESNSRKRFNLFKRKRIRKPFEQKEKKMIYIV
jgi:hypothetical protein